MTDESIAEESNQPESIEDMVSNIIDEAEVEEPIDEIEETEEQEESSSEEDSEEGESSEDEQPDDEEEDGTEEDTDLNESDDEESSDIEEKLDPPEHWAAADRELFSEATPEQQQFLLRREKDTTADYTRKMQEFAPEKNQYNAIKLALDPYKQEFAQAGLDYAGAVRQLASFHDALRSDGKTAILNIAKTYGIDMEQPESDEYTDPQVKTLQNQIQQLSQNQSQQLRQAQQEKQDQLLNVIQSFKGETGADGKLLHPHFDTLQEDMTRLIQAGIASNSDLSDAYNKALIMRPDLNTPVKEPVKPSPKKKDQAQIVKKAKKAATGVKSSGAVGKKNRAAMTLEQEIAAQIQ